MYIYIVLILQINLMLKLPIFYKLWYINIFVYGSQDF